MTAMHVGAVLAELLADRGQAQVLWANCIGISTKHMSQIITGKVGLSAEIAVRMEAYLGLDALALMRIQVAYEVAQARAKFVGVTPVCVSTQPLSEETR